MTEIIGVRFKKVGKIYYFSPELFTEDETEPKEKLDIQAGEYVIVETARGVECGEVVIANRMVDDSEIIGTLKPILRIATEDDLKTVNENREKEKNAAVVFEEKIKKHGLKMNLTDVEFTFDGNKILFYFTADGRVDFRELVKDLASVFKARIELRQIGVRDESKQLGGIGICGRPFCCSEFLGDFQPVSIKMAKEQGLSLNPTKISGTCGRLMCCLKYEQDVYEELLSITPKIGAYVETPEGKGTVVDCNLITGILKIRLDSKPDAAPATFSRKDLKIIKDVQIKVNKDEIAQLKQLEE